MISEAAVRRVHSFESLLELFRGEELKWDLDPDVKFDESTFDWSAEELSLSDAATQRLKDGIIRQLQPLRSNQKWGIFFVEFTDSKIYRTALRQILRRLVPNRRRESHLASWDQENILFICATGDYKSFTFAHFKGARSTNAKLSTFGWQVGDRKLRTLCEFNLPALVWPADDGANPQAWIANWSKAFDKEPLTRDFFKRFDKALERVKADLQEADKLPSSTAHTKSQLLLERLIFLYYLQNRGWLNQQRNYLVDNFATHRERPEEYSYYSDFLEKLFWTLASPPGSAARIYGIPFLNGGLFDDDEFAQNPIRRKQNPPLSIRNSTFAFVFDEFLEAFNFTVREDTPLNQEVAVDPEMLGKVFESIVLHAEAADPDAIAPDKRKATGSYYTPRIVVHFICQETLRLHLAGQLAEESFVAKLGEVIKVDASDGLDKEELQQLKSLLKPDEAAKILPLLRLRCCDPAVGSGAFPVGLLHELVNLRRVVETVANGYVDPLRKYGTQWLHETKADIIQNCLYGVDIQQQAIEICQLRLWLSLVVDYDLGVDPFTSSLPQFREAIERISQLPNLEMNFRRGDSLYDYISGVPLVIPAGQSNSHRAEFDEIKRLAAKLHIAKRGETKRKLRLEILERRLDISERVLESEQQKLKSEESTFINRLFNDETASRSEKRKRIEQEMSRIQQAREKIGADRHALERLRRSEAASDFQQKLRRLEGADFDSPLNLAWSIDFSTVFASDNVDDTLASKGDKAGGFDIIVGNPPFVTARNPSKRELYRERWPSVCYKEFQLVCPFFALSFSLLKPDGHIGFIVSNAFAMREFGKPLLEEFFSRIDLRKIVNCDGLSFPGHGTPTCIVLGRLPVGSNDEAWRNTPIRVATRLPGGGDLRAAPEESPLWQALSTYHDAPGFSDGRIIVADRHRDELLRWPLNFDSSAEATKQSIEQHSAHTLTASVQDIGYSVLTKSDDIFFVPPHVARAHKIEPDLLRPINVGDDLRNWTFFDSIIAITPYDARFRCVEIETYPNCHRYLTPFRSTLESVITFGKTKKQSGRKWFEYFDPYSHRHAMDTFEAYADIATHNHFVVFHGNRLLKDTAPLVILQSSEDAPVIAALLNSSLALFWLKQVCFNKGGGADEDRDRFEFATKKVRQFPLSMNAHSALRGKQNTTAKLLAQLSSACSERGDKLRSLAFKKLFEKSGEAYQAWNAAIPGYTTPHAELQTEFESTSDLRTQFFDAIARRDQLHLQTVALQEEMDWLVYVAYGLLPAENPAARTDVESALLNQAQRPFRLWHFTDGVVDRAVELIPAEWPKPRRQLWQARLEAIRDNEHIRRIEQPVYKRRWDEQWKIGNRWQSGQPAYDAEFVDAFTWWLSEKAEWCLEQHADSVSFDKWAAELWKDRRIHAAWPVVAEAHQRLELWKTKKKKTSGRPVLDPTPADFTKFLKALVKEQTVPEGIPFGIPFVKLKTKVSAHVKSIRGKLNVPRERFNVTEAGLYRVASPFVANTLSESGPSLGALPFE